jgi:hypothetical protein
VKCGFAGNALLYLISGFSLPFAIGRELFSARARFYSRIKFAPLALRAELRMRGEEPGALPCTLHSPIT